MGEESGIWGREKEMCTFLGVKKIAGRMWKRNERLNQHQMGEVETKEKRRRKMTMRKKKQKKEKQAGRMKE